MISFSHVSKSYAKQDLLVDCSFQMNPGERVGIIGANGTGKSTLFKLLMNLERPDEGHISIPKHLRLGYLPQDVLQFRGKTVLAQVLDIATDAQAVQTELSRLTEELEQPLPQAALAAAAQRQSSLLEEYQRLGGYELEAKAREVLAGLGFNETDIYRPVEEMSGGWAMRVALARILLSEPDLILLDEPTNHLDLDSLVWLEEHLVQTPSTLMLISHDRAFLDRVVHRLLELENGRMTSYPGDFQRYLKEKQKQRERQLAAYRQQQELIRQIKRFIDRNRVRKDRARQVQSRLKMLEKMEILRPPASPDGFSFSFPEPARASRVIAQLMGVRKTYGDLQVYNDLELTIERGDRIALIGPNGAGKTTLLKLLAGISPPDAGQCLLGSNVRIGYFAQQQLELLDQRQTVLESLSSVAGDLSQGRLRSLLGAFLFREDAVEKKISVLSGGERSRLLLCQLLVQQVNFLLLDEPTNHLDIQGRCVLEDALGVYNGTICLVSHDRQLTNAVANKIVVVGNGQVEMFHGNYDDYQEIWKQRFQPRTAVLEVEPRQTENTSKRSKDQKRLEAKWRNDLFRRKAPLIERLQGLEEITDEITGRLDELTHLLTQPATYENAGTIAELNREYRELKQALDVHNRQWEDSAMELESLEESFWQEKVPG